MYLSTKVNKHDAHPSIHSISRPFNRRRRDARGRSHLAIRLAQHRSPDGSIREGVQRLRSRVTCDRREFLHVGARPVLADIGADGNIDPEEIAQAVTPRTRAIIPVHFSGLPCDMKAIWKLARKYALFVIEDAAHAVGTRYDGCPIGMTEAETGADASDAVAFS